jgi:hypothetical protein
MTRIAATAARRAGVVIRWSAMKEQSRKMERSQDLSIFLLHSRSISWQNQVSGVVGWERVGELPFNSPNAGSQTAVGLVSLPCQPLRHSVSISRPLSSASQRGIAMYGPRFRLPLLFAVLVFGIVRISSAADEFTFGDKEIHLYHTYNADGFFRITGVELDSNEAIRIVYANPRKVKEAILTIVVTPLSIRLTEKIITEIDPPDEQKLPKKEVKINITKTSEDIDLKTFGTQIVLKAVQYDDTAGAFLVSTAANGDFRMQLEACLAKEFRYSNRPSRDVKLSASIELLGDVHPEKQGLKNNMVLRIRERPKCITADVRPRAPLSLSWGTAVVPIYYTYDADGFFKRTGIELRPAQLTFHLPMGAKITQGDLKLTVAGLASEKAGPGSPPIIIKNLAADNAGKFVVKDGDFANVIDAITKFSDKSVASRGPAGDIILSGELTYDSTLTAKIEGGVVVKLIQRP